MTELKDKVVLVTGASSGIGWSTALAFGRRGARLVLLARRRDKLAELAQKLRALGTQALEFPCDVSDPAQAAPAVDKAVAAWGRVDVLINNAGINEHVRFAEQSLENMDRIVRTNVLGAMYVISAVLGPMLRQRRGHIINVASIAGWRGLPYMSVYCASKFALVGLTEALRAELYGSGVTLTAFCPGGVDTPMAQKVLTSPKLRAFLRPKSPEDVAEKILRATLRRQPEVIYGEAPAAVVKLSKFFPKTVDWMAYRVYRSFREHYPPKPAVP